MRQGAVWALILRGNGFQVGFAVELAQPLELRGAVAARVVLEMRGYDTQRSERRLDDRFERGARHARHRGRRPGQRVAQHAADAKARGDQVAEALARTVGARHVHCRGVEHLVAGKRRAQRIDLVFALTTGQADEADADLLQAEDVRIGEAARLARDARRVYDAVEPTAPLHVPSEQPHY